MQDALAGLGLFRDGVGCEVLHRGHEFSGFQSISKASERKSMLSKSHGVKFHASSR